MAMKLSEAIREGAKLRPQGFNTYFPRDEQDNLCSCALGAAYEGLGGDIGLRSVTSFIENALGIDLNADVPLGAWLDLDLRGNITMLNDINRLTREEIANIVEAEGY